MQVVELVELSLAGALFGALAGPLALIRPFEISREPNGASGPDCASTAAILVERTCARDQGLQGDLCTMAMTTSAVTAPPVFPLHFCHAIVRSCASRVLGIPLVLVVLSGCTTYAVIENKPASPAGIAESYSLAVPANRRATCCSCWASPAGAPGRPPCPMV